MNRTQKIISIVCITLLLIINYSSMVSADITIIYDDPVDDVLFINDYINADPYNLSYNLTDKKPYIDIVNVSYIRKSYSTEVTLILEVNEKGNITDRNDFIYFNFSNETGTLIQYQFGLLTSRRYYPIQYSNKSCISNSLDDINYTVNGSKLCVSFNLLNIFEEFKYMTVQAFEINIIDNNNSNLYWDLIPNENLLFRIEAPYNNYVDEEINFKASIFDMFDILEPPYTFEWHMGDGSIIWVLDTYNFTINVTHIYDFPGYYNVELYFKDANNVTAFNDKIIRVKEREPNYNVYNVTWRYYVGYLFSDLGGFVSKNEPYVDNISMEFSDNTILTYTEFDLNWEDDNTYGLLKIKGLDTLKVRITYNDFSIVNSSIGNGNFTYSFNVNEIPENFTIIARSFYEAEEIVNSLISGKNKATFDLRVEIETGEKLFRIFKYLKDKGNDFSLLGKCHIYEYSIELIEE
jgi:hypothetical protein